MNLKTTFRRGARAAALSAYDEAHQLALTTRHNAAKLLWTGQVDLERTLAGGEDRLTSGQLSRRKGVLSYVSVPLKDSPHVALLRQYEELGHSIFAQNIITTTAYYQNAMACIRYFGHYFGHSTPEGVLLQISQFLTLYDRIKSGSKAKLNFSDNRDHSLRISMPVVSRTLTPNTYEIIDGKHRLSINYVLGHRHTNAVVVPARATELQRLVLKVSQTGSRRELYQPISTFEFDGWNIVRKCEDRLNMMLNFLRKIGMNIGDLSVIDLASSYGWFVSEFSKRGCHAFGVEFDPIAIKIGRIAYKINPEQVFYGSLQYFLVDNHQTYDVTLLLSILHHFVKDPRRIKPEYILRNADKITRSVLFFDMGQSHESWFLDSLSCWDDEYIINFIKENTTFSNVVKLGTDSDNSGNYRNNYGRSLFACFRS